MPEVEKRISRYNRAVKKLVKAIGGEYHGFKTGYGAWHYTLASMPRGKDWRRKISTKPRRRRGSGPAASRGKTSMRRR